MSADPIIRPATAEDAAPLATLWAQAFTPPLAPDQWLADPERFAHTLVAEDGDGVIGSIYGLPKRLREAGGGVARVHGIGSVAVADRARGRGIARRLVAATLESARRAGADWALLFTGTPEVYRSSGFTVFGMRRALSGPWTPGREEGSDRLDEVGREPVGPGSLAPFAEVYERSREGVELAPVRLARDWTMAEVRLAGLRRYAVERDGAVHGYAVAGVQDGLGVLAELAAPDSADVRVALLDAIAVDWAAAGAERCDLAVPDRAEDLAAVRAFAPHAAWTPDETGMTRPVGREPRIPGIRHFGAADYF